ncbi:unnamed protein product [Boreogadus saida]
MTPGLILGDTDRPEQDMHCMLLWLVAGAISRSCSEGRILADYHSTKSIRWKDRCVNVMVMQARVEALGSQLLRCCAVDPLGGRLSVAGFEIVPYPAQ